jgi:Fe-S oxidoreductase
MLARVEASGAEHIATDCPLSALRIREALGREALHPIVLLRRAYADGAP